MARGLIRVQARPGWLLPQVAQQIRQREVLVEPISIRVMFTEPQLMVFSSSPSSTYKASRGEHEITRVPKTEY